MGILCSYALFPPMLLQMFNLGGPEGSEFKAEKGKGVDTGLVELFAILLVLGIQVYTRLILLLVNNWKNKTLSNAMYLTKSCGGKCNGIS